MTGALLGIDLGTSSLKAVAISPEGTRLAEAARAYPVATPKPGWAEQDPELWWRACQEAVREVTGACDEEVLAVGFTGQMHSFVLLDEAKRLLRPAITWLDTRAAPLLPEVLERLQEADLLARLANPVVLGLTLLPLVWLVRYEPEVLARASHLVLAKDYLRFRCTGDLASEPTDASATSLFDSYTGDWCWEVLDLFCIPRALMPPLKSSYHSAGRTKGELGLAGRPPAAYGAGDQQAAAVANGVLDPGDMQLMVGTGAQILAPVKAQGVRLYAHLHTFRHVEGWLHQASVQNAGLALEWARAALGMAWPEFTRALEDESPSRPLFLPYLTGERTPLMNARARGAWLGLKHGHTPADLARAAAEGVAVSIADALQSMLALPSLNEVSTLRASGGALQNPAFAHLVSNATGKPLSLLESGAASAFGAAILGGVAAGVYCDLAEGVREAGLAVRAEVHPDETRHRELAERLEVMRQIYGSGLFDITNALNAE